MLGFQIGVRGRAGQGDGSCAKLGPSRALSGWNLIINVFGEVPGRVGRGYLARVGLTDGKTQEEAPALDIGDDGMKCHVSCAS